MRIAYLGRQHLYTNTGGDTVQIQKTREWVLRQFDGIQVEIFHGTAELLSAARDTRFDIIHIFGLCFPHEICGKLNQLKAATKFLVVSSIYVDYSEFEKFGRENRISRFIAQHLGISKMEWLKVVAKFFIGRSSISLRYLIYGHQQAILEILNACDLVLPNSDSELLRLRKNFAYRGPAKVVTNGVDTDIFNRSNIKPNFNFYNRVVCVGRIEGLKNQLSVINACNALDVPVVLIGNPAMNQPAYFKRCLNALRDKSLYLGPLPQHEIAAILAAAAVSVLPSWFETTGLVSLEAATMGAPIVITDKGDTREYFGNGAYYCDPASVSSIQQAIHAALQDGRGARQVPILSTRTWKQAARQTHLAYSELMDRQASNLKSATPS